MREDSMMSEPRLVAWPESDAWRDTGEGGLFAWLVVPAKEYDTAATVDCWAMLSDPDVALNHKDLWPHAGSFSREEDENSAPLAAAVFLGSTRASLWNDEGGTYFIATAGDLTKAGADLHALLYELFGVRPLIATFLVT
jgi:hypothetical protein